MYAETFDVRSWLETPAKWLRWAMQSETARNFGDTAYNLEKFWDALSGVKSGTRTPQEWGEIMTLDAQSQWALGTFYEDAGTQLLLAANGVDEIQTVVMPWLSYVEKWTGLNPTRKTLSEALDFLSAKASEAFSNSLNLSGQAAAALQSVQAPMGQSQNTITVASSSAATAQDNAAWQRQQAENMFQPPFSIKDLLAALKNPLGVPWYFWAGGAVLLLVLLAPPAPRISIGRDR